MLTFARENLLGCTDNFLQHRIVAVRCNPTIEIFDSCLDATEYVPTGSMIDFKGYQLVSTVQVRF